MVFWREEFREITDCNLKQLYMKFSLMRATDRFYVPELWFGLAVSLKLPLN